MTSPNKKERRRERLRREEADALARELARPRRIDEDFRHLVVGHRRVQLLVLPSFDPVVCWDIRGTPDGLALYQARGPAHQDDMLSPGYWKLDCPKDVLEGFVRRLSDLRLPLAPPLPRMVGLDGTTYEIGIFGLHQWSCRFRWWEDLPEEWAELAEVAREMVSTFGRSAVIGVAGSEHTEPGPE
jgi:hypothetical protein